MLTKCIGLQSDKVKNVIERGAVKKFAHAIGDPHPLYVDEQYGKQSKYKENLAPVTFPITLDYGVIEELKLPAKGLIHGEENFYYQRPLRVGEEIYCYRKVENYIVKEGKSGSMGILTLMNYGDDAEGNNIYKAEHVIILSEVVRKGMAE